MRFPKTARLDAVAAAFAEAVAERENLAVADDVSDDGRRHLVRAKSRRRCVARQFQIGNFKFQIDDYDSLAARRSYERQFAIRCGRDDHDGRGVAPDPLARGYASRGFTGLHSRLALVPA